MNTQEMFQALDSKNPQIVIAAMLEMESRISQPNILLKLVKVNPRSRIWGEIGFAQKTGRYFIHLTRGTTGKYGSRRVCGMPIVGQHTFSNPLDASAALRQLMPKGFVVTFEQPVI